MRRKSIFIHSCGFWDGAATLRVLYVRTSGCLRIGIGVVGAATDCVRVGVTIISTLLMTDLSIRWCSPSGRRPVDVCVCVCVDNASYIRCFS